ncbi:MAG: hypothetical protein ACFFCP_10975, partial [Promethearchaeota archaeon]
IGDQTKYDNWLLGGVDFLILDEENYSLWRDGEPFTSLYEKETVVKLRWIVKIPHTGVWYVIYVNDSIYMKRIDSSIEHSGPNDILIPLVGLIGVAVFLLLGAAKWKQNH